MTKFNTLSSLLWKLVGVALTAAILTSCVKAQKQDPYAKEKPKRDTHFKVRSGGDRGLVEDLNLEGYDPNLIKSGDVNLVDTFDVSLVSKDAQYTNRRDYVMTICGIEDMREGNLLGQRFNVYSEIEVNTRDVIMKEGKAQSNNIVENNGCIYFQASIPYDHFGKSVNLAVNFIFVSTTGMPTYIRKQVMFNPWDGDRKGNPQFLDYTRRGIMPGLRNMTWAEGYDRIQAALNGKIDPIQKRLEVGRVSIQALDNTQFMKDNLIGDALTEEFRKIKEDRAKMSGVKPIETMDVMLSLELKDLMVQLTDSLGKVRPEPLNSGHFRITAQLIAADSDYSGYYILTRPMVVSDERQWKADNMGVRAVIPFSVVMRPTYGSLKIALRVEPVDIPGVGKFEGLYDIGDFNQLFGSKSPLMSLKDYYLQDGILAFNLEHYLKKAKNYQNWGDGFPELSVNESTLEKGFRHFTFTPPEIKFSRVMSGDTATERTIQYTVSTCLVDTHSYGRPDKGLKFYIETEDRGHSFFIHRETDTNGCLNWVGMITHKFYQREAIIKKISKLRYDGKDADKPVYELEHYINPWDEKFGTFGRNASQVTPEYLKEVEESQKRAPPTQLLITEFHYDATGFRYVIDKYMNMTVKKTVLMAMRPTVLKYNSILSGRSGTQDMRDGIYLLKVAMQKDYLDPAARGRAIVPDGKGSFKIIANESDVEKKQFLTIKEMLVRVMGGKIVTPIEFDIKDLRTLRIRSQMIMQIETIDEMLLRVAALHAERTRCLKDAKCMELESLGKLPNYTPALIDLTKTQDEITYLMEKYKGNIDGEMERKALQELSAKKDGQLEKLKQLVASVDGDTLKAIYEHHDWMVRLQQGEESSDGNLAYGNTNAIIQSLRGTIQSFNNAQFEKDRIEFEKDQGASCLAKKKELEAKGDTAQAKLYEPNPSQAPDSADDEGALCFKTLSLEQLYYQQVDNNPYLADAHLRSLFGDEYSLYMKNIMPDDLTRPLVPDFDFSLLSNQGDELANGGNKDLSGLPRRTFIGPVTFVLNGNGSAMRPTDALDEAHCNNTCAQLPQINDLIAHSNEAQRADVQAAIAQARSEGRKVYDFATSPNTAYEHNPYYGSVKHFYQKQVNDLIPMERGLSFEYEQEMRAFSHLGNLAEQMRLDYSTFAAKPNPIKQLDYACYTEWKSGVEETYKKWRDNTDIKFEVPSIPEKCFTVSKRNLPKQTLMNVMSNAPAISTGGFANKRQLLDWKLPDVTEAQYKAFAKNGLYAPMSFDVKVNILHRYCYMGRKNLLKNNRTEGKGNYAAIFRDRVKKELGGADPGPTTMAHLMTLADRLEDIEEECHKLVDVFARDIRSMVPDGDTKRMNTAIRLKAAQLPISVERKIRVVDTSGRYIYKDGKTVNYSVSANFSLSNAMGVNRGYKVDPLESVEKVAGLIGGGVVSGILGSVFGMANFNWATNESLSESNGTSVSEGATLATQISTLDIELGSWEKCVAVKFEPQFFVKSVTTLSSGISLFGSNPTFYRPDEDIRTLGHMLCSGDVDEQDDFNPSQKVRVREHYYYLTQIFNEGDMQDPQSLANHPWMLTLRGARDFGVFQKALKVPQDDTVNWSSGYSLAYDDITSLAVGYSNRRHGDTSQLTVAQAEEIHKSLSLMSQAYLRALPTFPGMYTFSDTVEDDVSDWTEDGARN